MKWIETSNEEIIIERAYKLCLDNDIDRLLRLADKRQPILQLEKSFLIFLRSFFFLNFSRKKRETLIDSTVWCFELPRVGLGLP